MEQINSLWDAIDFEKEANEAKDETILELKAQLESANKRIDLLHDIIDEDDGRVRKISSGKTSKNLEAETPATAYKTPMTTTPKIVKGVTFSLSKQLFKSIEPESHLPADTEVINNGQFNTSTDVSNVDMAENTNDNDVITITSTNTAIKGYQHIKKKCWYFSKLTRDTLDKDVEIWLKETLKLNLLGLSIVPSRTKSYKAYRVTLNENDHPPEDNDTRLTELGVNFKEFTFRNEANYKNKNKYENRRNINPEHHRGSEMRSSSRIKQNNANSPDYSQYSGRSNQSHRFNSRTPNRQNGISRIRSSSKSLIKPEKCYRRDSNRSRTRKHSGYQYDRNDDPHGGRRCYYH